MNQITSLYDELKWRIVYRGLEHVEIRNFEFTFTVGDNINRYIGKNYDDLRIMFIKDSADIEGYIEFVNGFKIISDNKGKDWVFVQQ